MTCLLERVDIGKVFGKGRNPSRFSGKGREKGGIRVGHLKKGGIRVILKKRPISRGNPKEGRIREEPHTIYI